MCVCARLQIDAHKVFEPLAVDAAGQVLVNVLEETEPLARLFKAQASAQVEAQAQAQAQAQGQAQASDQAKA